MVALSVSMENMTEGTLEHGAIGRVGRDGHVLKSSRSASNKNAATTAARSLVVEATSASFPLIRGGS